MGIKLQFLFYIAGLSLIHHIANSSFYSIVISSLIALWIPAKMADCHIINLDFINIKLILNTVNILILASYCTFFLTYLYIKLIKCKFNQPISQYIKQHAHKQNTPTMGGLIFLSIFSISSLYLQQYFHLQKTHYLIILLTVVFGLIGLLDDYLKIVRTNNVGAKASYKFLLQTLSSLLILLSFKHHLGLSYLSVIWWTFVITGTANAVNLTDGLDGLAASCSLITILSLSLMYLIKFGWSMELFINAIMFVVVFSFLQFNRNPAKVFMGDVGSMSLGVFIAINYLLIGKEWTLVFAGIIFVLETVSVIMQKSSIKLFGRKIFRATPIHHHFEYYMNEKNITRLFVLFTIIANAFVIHYAVNACY